MAVSILIADDHSIVRTGIRLILKSQYPFAEIQEAFDGDQVIEVVKKRIVNLVILDLNMPLTDPFVLVRNLVTFSPTTRILAFTMNSETVYARRFFQLGISGYLHKESDESEIVKAIADVLAGKMYVGSKLAQNLPDGFELRKEENPFEGLSDREIALARCMLLGYTSAKIKQTLHLHSSTIGTYKSRLYEKLKIKSMVELVELARVYGFSFFE